MIGLLIALPLASAPASQPPITCTMSGNYITVSFYDPDFHDPVLDKFAIVVGSMYSGRWLTVVDTDAPSVRLSPFRPGMKSLVIDTRRQLAQSWEAGSRPIRAFPKPGLYTLVFSESLSMDLGDMIQWNCRVRIRR